jgi:hypothetical protein
MLENISAQAVYVRQQVYGPKKNSKLWNLFLKFEFLAEVKIHTLVALKSLPHSVGGCYGYQEYETLKYNTLRTETICFSGNFVIIWELWSSRLLRSK